MKKNPNLIKMPKKGTKNNKYIKFPYLDNFQLDKINKLIHDSRSKNSLLYNKIIQPYNNTKTLLNNISYKQPKIFLQNENINPNNNLNLNEKNSGVIKEENENENFDFTFINRNNGLKTSKSCVIKNNRYNLGNTNHFFRNQSATFGNCFACYFGCSVSRSGYSPMNYSPYDGRKREDNLYIPTEILYKFEKKNLN